MSKKWIASLLIDKTGWVWDKTFFIESVNNPLETRWAIFQKGGFLILILKELMFN